MGPTLLVTRQADSLEGGHGSGGVRQRLPVFYFRIMLRILQWLLFGHIHEWKIIKERRFEYEGDFSSGVCVQYHLQCIHCGTVKRVNMK